MFYYLSGKLALVRPDIAVIDCNGVGWKLAISENTYKQIAKLETATLYTYLSVKEDALDLFGFYTEQEKQFFELLIAINGVGPKAAMAILSAFTPSELAICVVGEDIKAITKANGIGAKTAQRICLELKDKIAKTNVVQETGVSIPEDVEVSNAVSDAVAVLMAMGYQKNDASRAVSKCSADNAADIVKQALRLLAKNI